MSKQVKELKEQAILGRARYRRDECTLEEAKELVMPYINAINSKSKEIAKKYNQKPKMVNFRAFVR